jgi:hypothetical protein
MGWDPVAVVEIAKAACGFAINGSWRSASDRNRRFPPDAAEASKRNGNRLTVERATRLFGVDSQILLDKYTPMAYIALWS